MGTQNGRLELPENLPQLPNGAEPIRASGGYRFNRYAAPAALGRQLVSAVVLREREHLMAEIAAVLDVAENLALGAAEEVAGPHVQYERLQFATLECAVASPHTFSSFLERPLHS
jgi:hypothetical protein